jgi:ferredoxin--NADP+ reductase
MRHIAIIGSGPAGYYTAEAAIKAFGDDVTIDIIDRLPVPYGLIRFGVAPDHQSIKNVARRFEATALNDNVHFCGNISVGKDISIEELQQLYDAVVLATGAPNDRPLDIPNSDLSGVIGSAAFVGWYNGHPDFANLAPPLSGKHVAIIGNGNVALDVARILAKTREEFATSDITENALLALTDSSVESITLLGRRGPHQIAMTPKELAELGHLERATPIVDPDDLPEPILDSMLEPGIRKSVTHLRNFAQIAATQDSHKPVQIAFDFYAIPVKFGGDGKVESLTIERTKLDSGLRSIGTGETYDIPCDLAISCIGYRTPPIDNVPYEHGRGRFASNDGRILPGLYCVGWARRGPSGTIGTNRPDGFAIVERMIEDNIGTSRKTGRAGLNSLMANRKVEIVTFRDWKNIDKLEVEHARQGAPREKITNAEEMIAARKG